MFGRRRALVAVLATAAAVLALGQSSSGLESPSTAPHAATSEPASKGTTVITSRANGNNGDQVTTGSSPSQMSGNGNFVVFQAGGDLAGVRNLGGQTNVYVRNLTNGDTTQISVNGNGGTPDGDSGQPSISADGEFVSFLTTATDIVALPPGVGANPTTLVICDRTPPSGRQPCTRITTTSDSTAESIVTSQRPRLDPSGLFVTWTASDDSGSAADLHVAHLCELCGNNPPTVDIGTVTGGFSHGAVGYADPVPDDFAEHIVFVVDNSSEADAGTCPAFSSCLMRSNLSWQFGGQGPPTEGRPIRLDMDPDNPNGPPLGNESDGFTVEVTNPSVTDEDFSTNKQEVAFRFLQCCQLNFAQPPIRPAALTGNGSWELVATIDDSANPPTVTTKVVSLDDSGQRVDGEDGSISRDGRFVAYVTGAANTHDGTDPTCTADPTSPCAQIVVRDLKRDPNGGILKGALATPHCTSAACDPPHTGSTNSTTTPPCQRLCPFTSIFIDDTGSKVSFDSNANDLVANDQNASGRLYDTFVRTWTPDVVIDAPNNHVDLGATQEGTSIENSVPITVTGFGPLSFSGQFATTSGGSAPGDFSVVNPNCATIYSGDDCFLTVRFTPSGSGTRTSNLVVKADQYTNAQQAGSVQGSAGPALFVAPGDTTRTSLTDGGGQGTTQQFQTAGTESMISGNGRWDVFVSDANLAGINNGGLENVFVRDLQHPGHTVQLSQHASNAGIQGDPTKPSITTGTSPDGFSIMPSISDDGRFVSFVTQSEDIVPTVDPISGRENSQTLVVCDRDPNGTMNNGQPVLDQGPYACFAVPSNHVPGFGAPPRLSGDGTKIAWSARFCGENCVPPVQTSTLTNTPGGTLGTPQDPVTVPLTGIPGFKSDVTDMFDPVLTRDGSKVVYRAEHCDNNGCNDAVIETALPNGPSVRLDVDPSDPTKFLGDTNGGNWTISDPPATSADGSRVAFAAANGTASLVFVTTLTGNAVGQTVVESRDNTGRPAAGYFPALSGDGHYLAFLTDTSSMHDGVDNLSRGSCERSEDFAPPLTRSVSIACQVVARDLSRDLQTGGNPWRPSELVSSSLSGDCMPQGVPLPTGRTCAGNGDSVDPSVDATGSEIGFDSVADDLVDSPADTNKASDSFVHTWRPTLTGSNLDFGNVTVGAHRDAPLTLAEPTLTDPTDPNHIFGPISPGSTPIAGADATDFAEPSSTCTGVTLNPDPGENNCTLTVRFTPSVAGPRNATVAVNTGSNGFPRQDPHVTVSLTGVGRVHTPHVGQLTVEPAKLDFGKRLPLAPPRTKAVTLKDTGTGPVAITDVLVSDTTHPGASGDYTVDSSACPAALAPGASCTISVSFVGHAVGNRGAQLVITDDAPGPSTVVLLASVPKPTVTANPGVTPPGRVTTISGTGFAPHRKVDVGLKGFGEHAVTKTDAHGAFEVALVIFRNTPQGPQTITAHTRGVSKSISATGPLLLAVGSVDVLQLVTRH